MAWEEQRERRLAARRRAKAYGTHVVYYVLIREGVVKIGTTSSLVERMSNLRLQPEDVLAAEPGHHALEKQRHAQFEALRIRKRWEDFTLTGELRAHIEAVAEEYGNPFEMQGWLMGRMREAEKDRQLAEAEQLA
ncbi:GIY-YIG nuclease family protein [Micromonospora sp. NPDC023814]|uniref:GIY-YIG nuclease family protein n=1 Tax=Micromonospora sp. NPDC023814 TaxID=3154596 RepID=UPI0033F2037F